MSALPLSLAAKLAAVVVHADEMLSPLGREMYFPKGILSQGAEAKARVRRVDA